MKGQLSVSQYRAIDLSLFAVMLMLFETVTVTAATRWFPGEAYTVSVVGAVTAIVLMRWGAWGALHAVLGGLVYCLVSRAAVWQYAVYMGGNLFGLGALLLFRVKGRETVRGDALLSMAFGGLTLLLMQAGRALISLLFGAGAAAIGFFTTDVVSLLFTLVVVWIARRLDGVFEDQRHYLLRVQEEREKEKGGFR